MQGVSTRGIRRCLNYFWNSFRLKFICKNIHRYGLLRLLTLSFRSSFDLDLRESIVGFHLSRQHTRLRPVGLPKLGAEWRGAFPLNCRTGKLAWNGVGPTSWAAHNVLFNTGLPPFDAHEKLIKTACGTSQPPKVRWRHQQAKPGLWVRYAALNVLVHAWRVRAFPTKDGLPSNKT